MEKHSRFETTSSIYGVVEYELAIAFTTCQVINNSNTEAV